LNIERPEEFNKYVLDFLEKVTDYSVSEAMSYGLTRQMIIDLLTESK